MEQHEQRAVRVVLGPILHSYPPFTVRQQIVEGTRLSPYSLPERVITMPFRGEEYHITTTYDSRDDVPWVIHALRKWMSDRPRIIRYWEEHLAEFQRPEGMARIDAALAAEREKKWAHPEDSSSDDNLSTAMTAEQVLANQRDELERIRQLTYEVEQGLQTLEAAHPEAVAALDEVAEEISRTVATRRPNKG